MVHLDHLWVTPYHPIIDLANDEKDWKYPISKGTSQNISCPYMYSFIVENRQALMIDRHVFATYGHNCVDQDVIQHDYFGTDKIIEDLKKMSSYEKGMIELTPERFIRDSEKKEVIRIE